MNTALKNETIEEDNSDVAMNDDESQASTSYSGSSSMKDETGSKPLKYLFQYHIPIHVLFELLQQICVKKDKYYLYDFNAFRLLQFHKLYEEFSGKILLCYKPSKRSYVTRKLTYNSFATIIRHICRINTIKYKTQFNYQHSLYNIDYYIYHDAPCGVPYLPTFTL
jgi:hypothetical protein